MAKKKRRPADDEDDDAPKAKAKKKPPRAPVVEDDDIDDDAAAILRAKKTGENAYTGLLVITFLALVGAAVLLYLDFSELGEKPIPQPSLILPGLGSTTPAAPGGPNAPVTPTP